jgi:uncharacterized membrane protein
VLLTAAGGLPIPTLSVSRFSTAGIMGVTEENLSVVIAAIAATPKDGSGVGNMLDLQDVVDAVVSHQITALAFVSSTAQINSATGLSPSITTYFLAGVSGVTSANLATVNADLNTAFIDGSATDTLVELQMVVTSSIFRAAVVLTSSGGVPVPQLTYVDFLVANITGVTEENLISILSAIEDTSSDGFEVDTLLELQSVVTAKLTGMYSGEPRFASRVFRSRLAATLGVNDRYIFEDILSFWQETKIAYAPSSGVAAVITLLVASILTLGVVPLVSS